MRILTTLLLSMLWVLDSNAQEFGTHWISHPFPNDSSEVMFRKIYKLKQMPLEASINLVSAGNLRVYVNERNISTSLLYEGIKDSMMISRNIDITRFLRKGDNIIAVWYAPSQGHDISKQLSLAFTGYDQDSIPFYHQADGSWWCSKVAGCNYGNHEQFDNRKYTNDWKAADYRPSHWVHPTGAFADGKSYTLIGRDPLQSDDKLQHVLSPYHTYQDSIGYHIDFGRPFRGTIRVTIRGAHKGSTLDINGNQYICNGEMDEQAFYRLHFEWQRTFTIKWGEGFKHSCITNIEGLEIE